MGSSGTQLVKCIGFNAPQPCRHCLRIWIGIGYQWGFWLLLTTLTTFSLAYINPEKPRPSMDNGTQAASGTLQRRKTFSLRGQHSCAVTTTVVSAHRPLNRGCLGAASCRLAMQSCAICGFASCMLPCICTSQLDACGGSSDQPLKLPIQSSLAAVR